MKNLSVVALMSAMFLAAPASAEDVSAYPSKPIQFILPFDPGTASDQIGRVLSRLAEKHLGAAIQVVNKPGSGGGMGFTYIKNAKPDGYTIGMGTANLAGHKVYGSLDFNHHDLETPIVVHFDPSLMSVSATSDFKILKEFVDAAKERPGELTIATGVPGTTLYALTVDFMAQAGIECKLVPCSGGDAQPPILAGGGHVDACFSSPIASRAQIEAGNIRPIVYCNTNRHKGMPDIPSFAEEGYKATIFGMRGVITPKGVPAGILQKIHDAFKAAMDEPAYRDFVDKSSSLVMYAGMDDAKSIYEQQQAAFAAAAGMKYVKICNIIKNK